MREINEGTVIYDREGSKAYNVVKIFRKREASVTVLALDTNSTPVVIKCLFPDKVKEGAQGGRDEAIIRFMQEATILAKLNHPYIPRVLDVFQERGDCFVVLEFIDGWTLEFLVEGAILDITYDKVIKAGRDSLCYILEYLHTQTPPIVFRDLKPDNIIVNRKGELFLIDFGLARFFKEDRPHLDSYIDGNDLFGSPEVLNLGVSTDGRADIFSLGAVLLYLAVGGMKKGRLVRFQGRISALNFDAIERIPQPLKKIIFNMIDPERTKRPSTMGEVRRLLDFAYKEIEKERPLSKAELREIEVDIIANLKTMPYKPVDPDKQ